jgi:V8-like Glu-specific endopeptidase
MFEEKLINNEELFCIEGKDLKTLLHRSIGALTFINQVKKMAKGSAAIISPNLILTAAHNIFNKSYQKEYDDFKFYLGVDGVAEKYYEIESWRYLSEYKTCSPSNKFEYDYALLKLKTPINFD